MELEYLGGSKPPARKRLWDRGPPGAPNFIEDSFNSRTWEFGSHDSGAVPLSSTILYSYSCWLVVAHPLKYNMSTMKEISYVNPVKFGESF